MTNRYCFITYNRQGFPWKISAINLYCRVVCAAFICTVEQFHFSLTTSYSRGGVIACMCVNLGFMFFSYLLRILGVLLINICCDTKKYSYYKMKKKNCSLREQLHRYIIKFVLKLYYVSFRMYLEINKT